jgi:ATPase subunit of ABC transporter with duplicated ATPase domains
MLTVTDLAMEYGAQPLFRDVNLQLDRGNRYGIVGANGSGKSTLLRILTGEETSSGGDVNRPRSARMGVLEQDHFAYEDTAIIEVVMSGNKVLWDAMVEKEALLDNAHESFDDARYSHLEDIVMAHDGYGLEARAGAILEGLGIPTAVHQEPLRVLSGGFKLRALLGKTLAAEPDLLMLDEPTNHLDILAISWLEKFLLDYRGCCIVVSHDHRFLDQVCTHVLDVDYERVVSYKGNYTAFLSQKIAERSRRESEINKREKEIAEHKAFITRFKAKATKARQANSRQKRVEKIVIETLPQSSRRHPNFQFKARRASGRKVLEVKGLSKAYDEKIVLLDVHFQVDRGDRLAIIGPNGIGKSTLLKILVGELDADDGTFVWGHEADPGYFPQDHREALGPPDGTVKESMWKSVPTDGLGGVVSRLAMVLFSRDDVEKKVGNLSGGEAARLLFARIAALEPTVLVLDEPTNHLDLEGIEALADGLMDYDGTILFVSHDRWFVDKLATRVLELREDGVEDFGGTYADLMARSSKDHLDAEKVVAQANAEKRTAKQEKKSTKKKKKKKSQP